MIGFAFGVLVVAFGMIAPNLGTEFMPQLSEGAVAINVVRLVGTRTGRFDPLQYTDGKGLAGCLSRRSRPCLESHRFGGNRDRPDGNGTDRRVHHAASTCCNGSGPRHNRELTRLFEETLRDLPGQRLAYTQPIKLRLDELGTGSRSDIAVKLYGDDLDVLSDKAAEIERVLLERRRFGGCRCDPIDRPADVANQDSPRRNRSLRDSRQCGSGRDRSDRQPASG